MTDLRRIGKNLGAVEREARARFVRARLKQGATIWRIADELGLGKETLRLWWASYLKGSPANSKPAPKPQRQWRACVTCGADFQSQRASGAWLRMCGSCRAGASSVVFHGLAHDGRKGRAR